MSANREKARRWFSSQQEKMRADLMNVRAVHDHPTAKGDGTEGHWLQMLQRRLPARYRADRAFVIDANGNRSEQIDIVIHDRQFCPLLLDTEGCISVPAESVYAVIEVKQAIDAKTLEYAGKKASSVRKLHRTSASFPSANGPSRTKPKPILAGLVALKRGWRKPFATAIQDAALKQAGLNAIDIGCALEGGAFEVEADAAGHRTVFTSPAESSLIVFFLRLLHRLQMLGTVPAIEYHEYTSLVEPPHTAHRKRGKQ